MPPKARLKLIREKSYLNVDDDLKPHGDSERIANDKAIQLHDGRLGRPSKMLADLAEYFAQKPYFEVQDIEGGQINSKRIARDFPTLSAFCTEYGYCLWAVDQYLRQNTNKREVRQVMFYVRERAKDYILVNGMSGGYDSKFLQYMIPNIIEEWKTATTSPTSVLVQNNISNDYNSGQVRTNLLKKANVFGGASQETRSIYLDRAEGYRDVEAEEQSGDDDGGGDGDFEK